jgi:hypothetical protein
LHSSILPIGSRHQGKDRNAPPRNPNRQNASLSQKGRRQPPSSSAPTRTSLRRYFRLASISAAASALLHRLHLPLPPRRLRLPLLRRRNRLRRRRRPSPSPPPPPPPPPPSSASPSLPFSSAAETASAFLRCRRWSPPPRELEVEDKQCSLLAGPPAETEHPLLRCDVS